MATLLLSQGVPMLLAGDEFLRTQLGNNNAWCQDNEISWLDWSLAERHADFLRFVREMITFRKHHPALRRRSFFRGDGPNGNLQPDVIWQPRIPGEPAFTKEGHTLALVLDGSQTDREPDNDIYIAVNNSEAPMEFQLPVAPSGHPWVRVLDTAFAAPQDIVREEDAMVVPVGIRYVLESFSLIVLVSRLC
jgi:glycogen operon protein